MIASSALRTAGISIVSSITSCSRSTISAGVPLGATMPVHSSISMSAMPCSAKVGTSGKAGGRLAVVMPIARSLPAFSGPATGAEIGDGHQHLPGQHRLHGISPLPL